MKQDIHLRSLGRLTVLLAALAAPLILVAAPPSLSTNPGKRVIFPAKGQTPEQQKQDELAAYEWASKQTGWDPYEAQEKLEAATKSADEKADATKGSGVKTAAGGALLGLAIGAIAGDAGEGAAIGAAAGGLTGGVRSHRTRKSAGATGDAALAEYKEKFAIWDRNFAAAMEGKGYTVK